jgi:hypothetical protein
MLLAPLFLLAAVATATAAPTAAMDPILDRTVEEVYVQKGDVLMFLPELLGQLDIPAAGIDLGRIYSRNIMKKDTRPGGPRPDIVDDRPERQVGPLEMKKGTVRQVLDELVRQRPELSWRNENGVLLISSSATKGSVVQPVLDCRLPEFKADTKALDQAAYEMENLIRAVQPTEERTVSWIIQWRMNPVLMPRRPLDVPVTLDKANTPVRQLLTDMVRQVPGVFWIAYDEVDDPFGVITRFGVVTISRLGSGLRRLDLETLGRCLDETYAPLHGYEHKSFRADEAMREFRRRQHFHVNEVREALLKPNGLPHLMQSAKGDYNLQEIIRWACTLGDVQLTGALLDLVPTINKPENRYACLLGTELTRTEEPALAEKCVALWNRLLEDEDAQVRQEAKQLIEWTKEASETKP